MKRFSDLTEQEVLALAITNEPAGADFFVKNAASFDAIHPVWYAIATDAQGNAYAAAGSPARVYRITPQGQASIVFQPQELQVQALLASPPEREQPGLRPVQLAQPVSEPLPAWQAACCPPWPWYPAGMHCPCVDPWDRHRRMYAPALAVLLPTSGHR